MNFDGCSNVTWRICTPSGEFVSTQQGFPIGFDHWGGDSNNRLIVLENKE